MPAVAVRHERRKQEKTKKRPHHLYLGTREKQSPPSRPSSPSQSRAGTPTPSPANSPIQSPNETNDDDDIEEPQEYYLFGKVPILYVVVVTLLMGGIVLIVGLVQLKPGADANANRYYIIASGCFLLLIGFILTVLRCCILPWRFRRMRRLRKEESAISTVSIGVNNETTNNKGDQNGQPCRKESESTLLDGSTLQTETNRSISIEMATSLGSHDTLQSIKSPSEHDALIKKSPSNLGTSST